MPGIDFIQMEFLNTIDFYGVALSIGKFIFAIVILFALVHYLILKPKKFKFKVLIYDITGSGLTIRHDRGAYVKNKKDDTGSFRLMNDKNAVLKHPPNTSSLMDAKGKITYCLLKHGDSPFDYSAIDNSYLKEHLDMPETIPLSDQDWAKMSIKKASEKKTLGNWWSENKATIVFVTAMVLSLVICMGAVKMAQESASQTIGASAQQAEKFNEIAEALNNVAKELGGEHITNAPPPPPP